MGWFSCNILSCWAQLDSVFLWDSDLQIHISKNGLHLKLKQHQLWRTALQLSQDYWLSNEYLVITFELRLFCRLLPLSDQASLRSDTEKNNLVSPMHPLKFIIFHSTEGQTFYWSIMTAVDSIKCWCTNSGMTGQAGGFQNPEVCLQAFPSFLSPHSLPALLLAPSSTRSLTFIPCSFHLNRTETLAMQAIALIVIIDWWEHCSVFLSSRLSFMLSSSISK